MDRDISVLIIMVVACLMAFAGYHYFYGVKPPPATSIFE